MQREEEELREELEDEEEQGEGRLLPKWMATLPSNRHR